MTTNDPLPLECFYSYGYKGREMRAVRAPFTTTGEAAHLVGRLAEIDGATYEIVAIARQISGPIAKGEPIGVEVRRPALERSP